MRPVRPFALLLALAVTLAGCLSGDDAPDADAPATINAGGPGADETTVDEGSPLDDAAPRGGKGDKAHKHDYWKGQTEAVLVDGTYNPRFCGNARGSVQFGCFVVEMGNGSIVYQGTARMTVVATWNDPKVTGLSLTYRDAAAVHPDPIPVQSGVEVEIPVDAASADIPHSKESKWQFIFRGGDGQAPAGIALAPVHVKITIFRGLDLPLDPPHPDHWGDAVELDLGTVTGTLKRPEAEFVVFGQTLEVIPLPEGRIIPPGTTLLTVHYTYTVKDPASGVSYRASPLYKSAQNPWWRWPDEVKADQSQAQGTFYIAVEPEMTDSPYATESQWKFTLRQSQHESTTGFPMPSSWLGASPFDRDLDYHFHFVVSRTAVEHDMEEMED